MKTLTTLALSFFLMLSAGCSATGQARAADDGYFSQAELDSMLAPVALYPDSVLSHVLIAATYPLEVIQAARWSREHPGLRGEDAVDAVEYQDWDASVKALVAFPDLLQRMDEDLQWTQNLGDAFLVQEEEVIASIQYLRSEAYSQGHLRSNDRVKVVREREYIYIEPARTRVVYVPYYDPRVIWTNWRWSSYRPHYWHRPSGFSVSVNFYWGRPHYLRPNFYFSSFHWPTRRVVVVNHHHYYNERRFHSGRQVARFEHARHWRHDPVHRRGVTYRGRIEKTRFVENDRPASARVAASRERTVARAERREWSENKRRSSLELDRSRSGASSRSERVAELRDRNRDDERSSIASRGGDSRTADRSRSSSLERARSGNERASASRSSREATQRSISGRAPARAESRSRSGSDDRASTSRSSRVTESLRSSNRSSRSDISSRSSSAERSAALQRSLDKQRSTTTRRSSDSSRSSSQRNSISVPRSLSTRPSSSRESAPSRASSSSRGYEPRSAPSRSTRSLPQASSRASAPTRSAPSRSSSTRAAPQRRSTPAAPSRQSSAPSRRSESRSSRSSRSSASSRSRDGGGSRRDGERK